MGRDLRRHGIDRSSQVEGAVTVGVGTEKFEKRAGRRMHCMRLTPWGYRSGVPEGQIDTDLLDIGIGAAQCACRGSISQPSLAMQLECARRHGVL